MRSEENNVPHSFNLKMADSKSGEAQQMVDDAFEVDENQEMEPDQLLLPEQFDIEWAEDSRAPINKKEAEITL